MITLSKENITEYLKEKMPYLDFSKPLIISAIGEGSLERMVMAISTSYTVSVTENGS